MTETTPMQSPTPLSPMISTVAASLMSWTLAVGSWLSQNAHLLLSVVATVFSICGSYWAYRVSRATLSKLAVERELANHKLCADCIVGQPPMTCPFPEKFQPAACPKRRIPITIKPESKKLRDES